jgi:hypothetical protein
MAERLAIVWGFVAIAGLMAFVPNGAVWMLFGIGVALVVIAMYALLVRGFGRRSKLYLLYWNNPTPWWVDATFGVLGGIIVVSAAPGLFFGQPHWAIDHVYHAISLIIERP